MRDDNSQQRQEQNEQMYLHLANKPYTPLELAIIEHQKKQANLIKTVFDSEE